MSADYVLLDNSRIGLQYVKVTSILVGQIIKQNDLGVLDYCVFYRGSSALCGLGYIVAPASNTLSAAASRAHRGFWYAVRNCATVKNK